MRHQICSYVLEPETMPLFGKKKNKLLYAGFYLARPQTSKADADPGCLRLTGNLSVLTEVKYVSLNFTRSERFPTATSSPQSLACAHTHTHTWACNKRNPSNANHVSPLPASPTVSPGPAASLPSSCQVNFMRKRLMCFHGTDLDCTAQSV